MNLGGVPHEAGIDRAGRLLVRGYYRDMRELGVNRPLARMAVRHLLAVGANSAGAR